MVLVVRLRGMGEGEARTFMSSVDEQLVQFAQVAATETVVIAHQNPQGVA